MANPREGRFLESLLIIWVITAKDVVDALKSRLIIYLVLLASMIPLLPKLLPYIFEPPAPVLPLYGEGAEGLVASLPENSDLTLLPVRTEEELTQALCRGIYPQIGLVVPAGFGQDLAAGQPLELQGMACWSKRFQASGLQPDVEALLSLAQGRPVTILLEGNTVFPSVEDVLGLSLATLNAAIAILIIGIVLVPSLLFDEKQTRTLQALLVSPASISQVVIGKALAGFFYLLVMALVVFAISWADVVHWGVAMLFVFMAGIFAVSLGLVLGSFFEKPQDVVGWTALLMMVLIGAIFVKMIGLELPPFVGGILPWVPSVALAEICRAAFSETVPVPRILIDLCIILAFSLPLYALVIWKVRRSDRSL